VLGGDDVARGGEEALALGQRLYLSGEFADRESISKHKLENALQALRDQELGRVTGKGNVEPQPGSEGRLAAWLEELKSYLK